ncbi:hypothetical protein ISS30_04290 [bacterium]|nr:hypothetical protein [FCB group bacterium]MBL7190892.1 hypothetical protein [bacterium]
MIIKPVDKSEKLKSARELKQSAFKKADSVSFEEAMASKVESVKKVSRSEDPEIEDLQELHSQFVTSVNHELNNPLFVVKGMAQLLPEDTMGELSRNIDRSVEKMSGAIKDFNCKDIRAVGSECRRAPLEQINFRKDLVSCYLAKVIAPLIQIVKGEIEYIESTLSIDRITEVMNLDIDKVQSYMKIIKKQAERIKIIIERLKELLPENIVLKDYFPELKMIDLSGNKNDNKE